MYNDFAGAGYFKELRFARWYSNRSSNTAIE